MIGWTFSNENQIILLFGFPLQWPLKWLVIKFLFTFWPLLILSWSQAYLILLCFALLHFTSVVCAFSFKLKIKPSTSQKIKTCFIAILYYHGLELNPLIAKVLVCVYSAPPTLASFLFFLNMPDMLPPQGVYADNFLFLDCSSFE